jgi:hypothetical protein
MACGKPDVFIRAYRFAIYFSPGKNKYKLKIDEFLGKNKDKIEAFRKIYNEANEKLIELRLEKQTKLLP